MRFLSSILFFSLGQFGWGLPSSGLLSRNHARSKLGAVASESSVCSRIGVGLIKNGGSAADAVSGEKTFDVEDLHMKVTDEITTSQLVGTVFCVGVIGEFGI